jgi:hypothetical protein
MVFRLMVSLRLSMAGPFARVDVSRRDELADVLLELSCQIVVFQQAPR